LSQQIQSLERELGTQLFRRIPRRLALTDAGEVLLEDARWILARAEHAVRNVERAARGELGRLCVGFTSSASFHPFVPAMIRAFQQAYPLVSLSLRENDSISLCLALVEGNVDVAFIRPPPPQPERIGLDHLFNEDMLVALPAGHPLENMASIALADLSEMPFVRYPRQIGPSLYDAVIAACREAAVEELRKVGPPVAMSFFASAAERVSDTVSLPR
jgi:DNA-binding transcriptional LysR family regulator